MIEEVKKILEDYQLYLSDIETKSPAQSRGVSKYNAAQQIDDYYRQLFEPKPKRTSVSIPEVEPPEWFKDPKPDEGRLLTDEEIRKACKSINADMVNKIMDGTAYDKVYPEDRAIAKAQDAKTASIKDAEIEKEKRIRKHVQEELSIALDEYAKLHAECQERIR